MTNYKMKVEHCVQIKNQTNLFTKFTDFIKRLLIFFAD